MKDDAPPPATTKQTLADHDFYQNANALVEGGGYLLENLLKSSSAAVKNTLELTQEVMAFSQIRLHANFAAWAALASCRNPSDLPACQAEFTRNANAHYTNAIGKFSNLFTGLMFGALAPSPEHALKS